MFNEPAAMCTYGVMFASRVETMAVCPSVLVSLIDLKIDASIPAGAGNAARKPALAVRWVETRGVRTNM